MTSSAFTISEVAADWYMSQLCRSSLLVENQEIFIPHLYLPPPQGVTQSEFRKGILLFDADKTRMIGLPYGEKNYNNMLSRFHTIPESYGTDEQIDGQTDRIPISISRVSVMTRDKN